MNRLMKAESYRLVRTNNIFMILLPLMLLGAFLPTGASYGIDVGISRYIYDFSEMGMMIVMMIIPMGAAVLMAISYSNKTLYYEVMAGNKISHMLLSKVICVTGFLSVIQMGFILIMMLVQFISDKSKGGNGMGELSNLPLRILLIYFMILHAIIVAVLIVMTFKSALGAAVVFVRFYMLDMVLTVMVSMLADEHEKLAEHLTPLLMAGQVQYITSADMTAWYVGSIIISCVVESILWYIIAYSGYKKKNF